MAARWRDCYCAVRAAMRDGLGRGSPPSSPGRRHRGHLGFGESWLSHAMADMDYLPWSETSRYPPRASASCRPAGGRGRRPVERRGRYSPPERPLPLPVSWIAADPSLTDPWNSMVKLATSGAGWPPPPSEGTWADGPGDLAGEGGELADVLTRAPTGRLVVLGEPGAGNTMLMVRLVLDLLARRIPGGPVPFLASLVSLDPVTEDLRSWLGTQLLIDHPALANPPPTGRTEPTQAAALLASGLILPVLDGLDEIPKEVRGRAVSRINDALRPGEQVIMTCRTKQYRDAIRPPRGVEVTLRAAAAVQLRLLDADAIRNYLCDDAAGPVTRARGTLVLAVLGITAGWASIAHAAYGRPGTCHL